VRSLRVWARLLGVEDVVVESVDVDAGSVVVAVRPAVRAAVRAAGRCGVCRRRSVGYDAGHGRRRWRSLDVGARRAFVEADAPRVRCIVHGVVVAAMPWARHRAGHTRDFDAQVGWLVRQMSKEAVCRLLHIGWRTVGQIITRLIADADAVTGDRLSDVTRIGIDEVSYRRGHKYLTVVIDHDTRRLLWIAEGRDSSVLGGFFQLLGPARCARIVLVTADGAEWIFSAVTRYCPQARICLDPFHVVMWAGRALDAVRSQVHNAARRAGQKADADAVKGAKWALWKNAADLTTRQQAKLAHIEQTNQPLFRAYLLNQQLRQVFTTPGGADRVALLDAWLETPGWTGHQPAA
jgi:transposase